MASCLKLSSPSLEESSKTYKESLRSPINLCPSRAYKGEDATILAVPMRVTQQWEGRKLLTFLKTLKLGMCLLEDLLQGGGGGTEQQRTLGADSSAAQHKYTNNKSNPVIPGDTHPLPSSW